jgi:hypothetical protein
VTCSTDRYGATFVVACVVRGQVHKYTNLPHSAGWLCPSRERRRCRAAEQRDDLASSAASRSPITTATLER